jgi:hypothetical protein
LARSSSRPSRLCRRNRLVRAYIRAYKRATPDVRSQKVYLRHRLPADSNAWMKF